jgi:hypothetical protein
MTPERLRQLYRDCDALLNVCGATVLNEDHLRSRRRVYAALIHCSVSPSHVVVDNSGRSTYETCLRAKKVYGLDQAVLVTQNFHLARALYIANELGIDAVGMAANMSPSSQLDYQTLREWGAEVKAYFNLNFVRRRPLGENRSVRLLERNFLTPRGSLHNARRDWSSGVISSDFGGPGMQTNHP